MEQVRRTVADVFGLEVEQVTAVSSARTIDRWDSVSHLSLVLALEGEFNASFTPEEIDHLDSVEAIVRALEGRLAPVAARPEDASGEPIIRRLQPGDLSAVAALLSRRDGQDYERESVGRYLCGLDSRHLLGWLAVDQDRPVGLTTLYLRPVLWDGRVVQAGYWSHLYVHEDFRRQLVYPRLVHTMMEEAPAAGVELIYTGTRRPTVAEGHVGIGFQSLGSVGVRVKPLRPFALLADYRGWSPLAGFGLPLDLLYRWSCRLGRSRPPSGIRIEAGGSDTGRLRDLLDLLERSAGPRVHQRWTAESWRRRYAATLEGWPYSLLLALEGETLVGGLLMRVARRPAPVGGATIPLGIVMDLVVPQASAAVAAALLAEAENRALREGCQAMLWLDGVPELGSTLGRLGYRTSSETYRVLVWPPGGASPTSMARDLSNWRFPFSEHDAF